MKHIGQTLKEARENNGVSLTEAAEDLNLKTNLIEQVEEGNLEAFKDVHFIKEFIQNYCKYLGIDGDKILADFNEFIFDYTSKISIEETKPKKTENVEKVVSPYTVDTKFCFSPILFFTIFGVLIILIIGLLVGIYFNIF